MSAELLLADAYYAERPEKLPDGKWFFAVSRWLDRANKEALKAKQPEEVDHSDPYYRRMPNGWTKERWHETCPPEQYRSIFIDMDRDLQVAQ